MSKRWAIARIKLVGPEDDRYWQSQLQDPAYTPLRWPNFAFHRMGTDVGNGPEPKWTLEPLDDAQRTATKNDPDICLWPAVPLTTRVNQLTAAQWDPFEAFLISAGIDTSFLAGPRTLKECLETLGRELDPSFDADDYPLT